MTTTTPQRHYPDLTFDTLDPGNDGDQPSGRLLGWGEAVARGFHEGRMSDEMRRVWLEHLRVDRAVIRGVWQTTPAVGPGTIPVATFSWFDKSLNVGGARLPLRMITDITVSPTHRRQGLFRTLMTGCLTDAVDHGLPLAALTVSEGSIYGRFGFGLATHARHVEVDTTSRFALRDPASAGHGRMALVEPTEAWPSVQQVYARFDEQTRGSVPRPHFYESILTGVYDWEERGPDHKLRAAVHLEEGDEAATGYVLYKHAGRQDGRHTVDIVDLAAATPTAYLRLWRFLADIDLAERVRWRRAPLAEPLEWALVDPFAVRTTRVEDMLWVRVLDVVTALEARPWGADGDVVLGVDDDLGHAAGRYRLVTSDGSARVEPTEEPAHVRLDADTLGSLYLGGVTVATLYAAGRVVGDPAAVAAFGAMADAGAPPYCITGF